MATATVPKRVHAPNTTRRDDFTALLRPVAGGPVTDSSVVAWIQQMPGTSGDIDHDYVRVLLTQAQQTSDTAQRAAAQDELVRLNLRLVFTIATKFQNRGLDLWDLMQEGCMGLLRAVEQFDSVKFDNHFSTYAVWWIRCYILRAVHAQRGAIRLPEYAALHANHILHLAQGGMLSDAEIAAELGLPEEDVTLLRNARTVQSLDKQIEHHATGSVYDDDTLLSVLPDGRPPTETLALDALARQDVRALLHEHLSERECALVCMRYGLAPWDRMHTLIEVGATLGISRERVRQVEATALGKLRAALSEEQWRELLSSDGE